MFKKVGLLSLVTATSLLFAETAVTKIENEILNNNNGKYPIAGYFSWYEFSSDTKSNWTFTVWPNGPTYQLLGDTSEANLKRVGVFGWKPTNVTPNEPLFYMVQYDLNDRFGWLLFQKDANNNCADIYKLAGQDEVTKGFKYDVNGDGKPDKLIDLKCSVNGDYVEFYSETLQNNTPAADTLVPPSLTTADELTPPPLPQNY